MKNKKILIIGYDPNICLGVFFCLKDEEYSIYLLTKKKNNPAKHSRYLTGYFEYNVNDSNDEIINQIINITKENHINLIMPVDENESRLVSEYRETLLEYAACTWLPDVNQFDIGVNKRRLAKHLLQNNIPCPSFVTVSNNDELFEKANMFGYPVLVKPSRGYSGLYIKKINNRDQLVNFVKNEKREETEFILQPYINGADIDCSVLCKDGDIICYTIQQPFARTKDNFKPNESIAFIDNAIVFDISSKMMKLLNWNGVAHIDLRKDNSDNAIKVLEINGRFWASVVASHLKAGINFPLALVKFSLGEQYMIVPQKDSKQLSFKDYMTLKFFSKEKVSINDTKYGFYKTDPLARFYQMMEKVKKLLFKEQIPNGA